MTYMIGAETFNTLVTFMVLLFACGIACEWLRDDKKYLYQFVAYIVNALLGLVLGWALFTENVLYYSYGSMEYAPVGFVLVAFGAMNIILWLIVFVPLILGSYNTREQIRASYKRGY